MELHCCFSYITTWIEQGIRAWRKKGRKEGRKEGEEGEEGEGVRGIRSRGE